MVPRLQAAGRGECALDTGPAEDREPAEEDGAEMVARWTKEPWRRAGNEGHEYLRPKERSDGQWDLPEVEGTRLGRELAYQVRICRLERV